MGKRRGPTAPGEAFARARQSAYWREPEARAALAAYAASGEPLETFCRRHGVGVQRLRWWRQRLADVGAPVGAAPPGFVAVQVVAGPAASIEVVGAGAWVVRVPPGFDVATLQRVLTVVAAAPC